MAAVISIAVGAVGMAVGTAVGAAIGGTILGISAATIGGIIGAGIAGGVLSSARGGDFGKGFLAGAVGASIGSFMKGGFDGFSLGGGAADAGTAAATDAAGQAALEGITQAGTDAASGAVGTGLGETAAGGMSSVPGAEGGFSLDALGAGGGEAAAMSSVPGAEGAFSLADLGAGAGDAMTGSNLAGSAFGGGDLVQPDPMAPPTGNMSPATGPDAFNPSQTYGFSADPSMSPSADAGQFTLEGLGQNNPAPASAVENVGGGGGMFGKADGWLAEKFGMPQGSTAKLALGGVDGLQKLYQANQLERQLNGMKPLSFEEFSAKYADPNVYKNAANQMAKAGRTGTLPVLLARMKNQTRAKYADYLPGAQQQYLVNKAAVGNAKQEAYGSFVRPLASLDWSKA